MDFLPPPKPELWVPPAITRAQDNWKRTLDEALALRGANRSVRRSVIAEVERIAKSRFGAGEIKDLASWAERHSPHLGLLVASFASASVRGLRGSGTSATIALAGTIATTIFTDTSSSHALNMPSGITAGEFLGICMMMDRSRSPSSGLTGWTQLFLDTGSDPCLGFYYKTAAGGETVTIGYAAGLNCSYAVFRLTNWQGTPEAATATTGSSANPNSGSVSPSWGTGSASFLISMFSVNVSTTTTVSANPTNYTGAFPSGAGSGQMAYRIATVSSEDPDAFTINASGSWRARTVAIRST